jgi:tRNA wybutosine-synthesizing protein 1
MAEAKLEEFEDLWLNKLAGRLKIEKYQLIGKHSAVKKCSWLHKSLVQGKVCYKQKFYGIQSHRCLQLSPAVYYCTLRCLFCWRIQPEDLNLTSPSKSAEIIEKPDDPEFIVEEALKAQRRILSGYKAHKSVNPWKYAEALNPAHAAISLTGEPTLYPKLSELIESFHKRKMTTFLVTNATLPKVLENLSAEPTQLYISLHAPVEQVFSKVCRPIVKNGWRRIKSSLEALKSFSCSTVIRLTLVKGVNMEGWEKDYARLILEAEPTYVEVKAYMWVGFSRRRLRYEHMPAHHEVKAFAEKLAKLLGYNVLDESVDSRVILLSKLSKPIRFGDG